MLTNLMLPQGYVGPGATMYPVANNPGGAVLFVLASIGADNRGRLTFPGTAASTTQSNSAQGPFGDPNKPLATIFGTNGAISYCQAGRGDVIVVLPGHTETISAAVTLPAGVTVLGLGNGASRPTIDLGTATTNKVTLNAGSRLQNLIFSGYGVDAIVTMFITGGVGVQVISCRIMMADGTNQALVGFTVSHDDFLLHDTTIDATASAGANHAVLSGAAVTRMKVVSCIIRGNFAVDCLGSTGTNHITEMFVTQNSFVQRNGTAKNIFNFTTSSTGIISYNTCNGTTWSSAADVASNSTSTSLRWFENYGFDDGAGAVSGVLVPAVGTIS